MDDDFTNTQEHVYDRDGKLCWLCKHEMSVCIAHHIDAAASSSLFRFHHYGTIPSTVTDPFHHDNLIPLCPNCHAAYDAAFPEWVLVPDEKTLQEYINHEKMDYEQRCMASVPLPRSLPNLDRRKILYHPLIISHDYHGFLGTRINPPKWPKSWLGEPTTVIHRAACRGILEPTPVKQFSFGRGRGRGKWQTGIPEIFRLLVTELINHWAKQPPTQKK